MELVNRTPFSALSLLLPNQDGVDTLYTVVKATLKIGKQWTLEEDQIQPQAEDEFWGDPESTSLKYSTDFHIGKQNTDIAVVGSAHSFEEQPVTQLDVGLSVGKLQKVVRVFGDRQWNNGLISRPADFTSMPLIYEHAFGGQYHAGGELKSLERRNPVGKGYKGKKSTTEMNGSLLPNVEDPGQLISTMHDEPAPAGFGFCAPHWMPRSQFGGAYDEQWQKQRAPYLPKDFSFAFNNSASPGLVYPGYIQGGEEVKLVNMHPSGMIHCQLPVINIVGRLSVVRERQQSLDFNLETLIFEPDQMRVQMTWKARYLANNKASKINKIEIAMTRLPIA